MRWEPGLVAERTRDYELVMVLSPEAAEEEVAAAVERVAEFITERGGDVSNHETWGLRRLAYPIKRFQEGNYILAHFSMDAAQLRELDRSLTASEDVLRHLVTKVDKNARPVPKLATEPETAPETAPKLATEPETAPETAPKLATEPETAPETAPKLATEPETAPETEPETAPETETETAPETETEGQ